MTRGRRTRRAGFSLIEMMIALGLLGVIIAAMGGTIISVIRSYGRQTRAIHAQESLRSVELLLTRLVRSGRADPFSTNNATIAPDPLGRGTFDNIRVRSDFNPADGLLTGLLEDTQAHVASDTLYVRWQAGAQPQAVAFPVRSIRFEYFATNGTAITTAAQIPNATRVRLTLAVPRDTGSVLLIRRQSWIYLRN